ncbi:hypothetical protein SAMN05421747_106135 [Parapedobacter composti]|uniref:Uncharacterized protein n=1 Tax=Parapedobacter composti TaxID=623281 RepID=A0A1I1HDV7_9SPHI|nr:hypothetical protein [Parapedobacter composti]SFC22041.1 hypothetical protein SAMN05421747_106135 [Parapedobacter composti]
MKKMKFGKLTWSVLAAAVIVFSACSDDDPDPVGNGGLSGVLPNNTELVGDITEDVTLSAGNTYTLRGGVHVKDGATMTIGEGVTVRAITNSRTDFANTAYLLIERGAKIEAIGTADRPIVFTSNSATPAPQDWGGIIVCGAAPINNQGGENQSEMGGQGVMYGGTNANDNSGTLRYVRVEYTGKKQSAEAEHNGFTFEGVGAGTTLEYLAVYKGADDGIEFFGGTANLRYAFVNGAQDDLFDYTFGWSGKGQYWVGIQGDDVADRGIEADNNGDNHGLRPLSNPILSNVTLVGSREAMTNDNPDNATEADKGKTIGLKLRAGTGGQLHNFVIYGFNHGIDVQHDLTVANLPTGDLKVANTDLYGPNLFKFAPEVANPWTTITTSAEDTPSYMNGYVGTSTEGAINPSTLDSWFQGGNFKGAVEASNNWVTQGNWARLD